jgi:hypothetical protein
MLRRPDGHPAVEKWIDLGQHPAQRVDLYSDGPTLDGTAGDVRRYHDSADHTTTTTTATAAAAATATATTPTPASTAAADWIVDTAHRRSAPW